MNPETYTKLPDDVRDGLNVEIDRSLPVDIVEEIAEAGTRRRIHVNTFIDERRKERKKERQNKQRGREKR